MLHFKDYFEFKHGNHSLMSEIYTETTYQLALCPYGCLSGIRILSL